MTPVSRRLSSPSRSPIPPTDRSSDEARTGGVSSSVSTPSSSVATPVATDSVTPAPRPPTAREKRSTDRIDAYLQDHGDVKASGVKPESRPVASPETSQAIGRVVDAEMLLE